MNKYVIDEKHVRKIMIDKGIKSIAELSRLTGISKPKIYDYLNGGTPFATAFTRLCDYLQIDPNMSIIAQEGGNDKQK